MVMMYAIKLKIDLLSVSKKVLNIYYYIIMKNLDKVIMLAIIAGVVMFGISRVDTTDEKLVEQIELLQETVESFEETNTVTQQEAQQITGEVETGNSQEKIIEALENNDKEKLNKIKKQPTHLVVSAKFTQEFIDNYKYEDSCNYKFALWVDVKWNWDLFFYDVFRNENSWVSNDTNRWLEWAIPACKFVDWVTREIPLTGDVIWANHSKDWLWYHYRELGEITDKSKFWLSGIKESKDDFYVITTEKK